MNPADTCEWPPVTERPGCDSGSLRELQPPTAATHVVVWRDLAVVAISTLVTFAFAAAFELNESILISTRAFEAFEIDELPMTLFVLALACAWFAWRRWRDTRVELQRREVIEAELQRSESEYRMLSRHFIAIQEAERRNLARELHDELGQYLNAIKIDAVSIRTASQGSTADIHASATSIVDITDHVYAVVRGMMGRLRPVALDELGLVAALQHCIDGWKQRLPETRFEFAAVGDLDCLGEQVNMTLYRVVQECLTNVARHAQATQVRVRMGRASLSPHVQLSVVDNGKGMDPERTGRGLGLVGMRERVAALNGRFELESAPGEGMSIRVTLPLRRPAGQHGDD